MISENSQFSEHRSGSRVFNGVQQRWEILRSVYKLNYSKILQLMVLDSLAAASVEHSSWRAVFVTWWSLILSTPTSTPPTTISSPALTLSVTMSSSDSINIFSSVCLIVFLCNRQVTNIETWFEGRVHDLSSCCTGVCYYWGLWSGKALIIS